MYNFTKENNFIPRTSHKIVNNQVLSYKFRFISLIAPYLIPNLRLLTISSTPSTLRKATALMKQSYLLFTWFFYLKESHILNKKQKRFNKIKIAVLPVKRTLYTLTKAPMAHKTNSKEQFVFRFFKFSVSIKTAFNSLSKLQTIDHGLYIYFLTKNSFPIFETNILLLKNYTIIFNFSDKVFFSFYELNKVK